MNAKKISRQRAALARLEKQYEVFKAANKDKEPRTVTRKGKIINLAGRSYKNECERFLTEIANLKNKLVGKM